VQGVADALVAHCLEELQSSDNVTCAVIFLQPRLLEASATAAAEEAAGDMGERDGQTKAVLEE